MENIEKAFSSIVKDFGYKPSEYFIRSKKLSNSDDEIIVIAGATGTGKSDIAIELAKMIDGYIINADSRQIYKEIKIGTARPQAETIVNYQLSIINIDSVMHLLYGYVSLKEKYSLFRYQKDVNKLLKVMKNLYPQKRPIIVGGTGLYIDSVIYNYKLVNKIENIGKSRADLMKLSLNELQEMAGKNLKLLNESDQNNPHRLIRLIERGGEIYEKGPTLPHYYFVLQPPMEKLEKRLKTRIDKMVETGLLDEISELQKNGMFSKMPSILAYKEFEGYPGNKTLEQVKEEIFLHTRQYAKRQRTWFKRQRKEEREERKDS